MPVPPAFPNPDPGRSESFAGDPTIPYRSPDKRRAYRATAQYKAANRLRMQRAREARRAAGLPRHTPEQRIANRDRMRRTRARAVPINPDQEDHDQCPKLTSPT